MNDGDENYYEFKFNNFRTEIVGIQQEERRTGKRTFVISTETSEDLLDKNNYEKLFHQHNTI